MAVDHIKKQIERQKDIIEKAQKRLLSLEPQLESFSKVTGNIRTNTEGSCKDLFHGLPDVAILPNPTTSGTTKLKDHVGNKPYKFSQDHLNAITAHSTLGAVETDTVVDLAGKAQAVHPQVKFRIAL